MIKALEKQAKEDEWGVQGRTPIEGDAENPWNHMGPGVLPSVHRR